MAGEAYKSAIMYAPPRPGPGGGSADYQDDIRGDQRERGDLLGPIPEPFADAGAQICMI
jgi:hypothetical protein